MSKRLQFVVDDKAYEAMERLKSDTGANSLVEVFRNALKSYEWIVREIKSGNEVISKPTQKDEKKYTGL